MYALCSVHRRWFVFVYDTCSVHSAHGNGCTPAQQIKAHKRQKTTSMNRHQNAMSQTRRRHVVAMNKKLINATGLSFTLRLRDNKITIFIDFRCVNRIVIVSPRITRVHRQTLYAENKLAHASPESIGTWLELELELTRLSALCTGLAIFGHNVWSHLLVFRFALSACREHKCLLIDDVRLGTCRQFRTFKKSNNNIIKRYKSRVSVHTRQTINGEHFLPAALVSQAEQFAIVKIFTHAIEASRKGERIQNQTNSGSHHLERQNYMHLTNWADNRTFSVVLLLFASLWRSTEIIACLSVPYKVITSNQNPIHFCSIADCVLLLHPDNLRLHPKRSDASVRVRALRGTIQRRTFLCIIVTFFVLLVDAATTISTMRKQFV